MPMHRCFYYTIIFLLFISAKPNKEKKFSWQEFEKSFVFIPKDSIPLFKGRLTLVDSFYINKFEVTNKVYNFFLDLIKKDNYVLYEQLLPDTNIFYYDKTARGGLNGVYSAYYFKHIYYTNHPVIGITHSQADLFCREITRLYDQFPKKKFKKIVFKLPSEEQWRLAAYSPAHSHLERKRREYDDQKRLPWVTPVTTKKFVYDLNSFELCLDRSGKLAANFSIPDIFSPATLSKKYVKVGNLPSYKYIQEPSFEEYCIKHFNDTNKYACYSSLRVDRTNPLSLDIRFNYQPSDIPISVCYYKPSNRGLYDLGGNVAEFIADYGYTKGGSFDDLPLFCKIHVSKKYDKTIRKDVHIVNGDSSMIISTQEYRSVNTGFRIAMEFLK